MDFLFNGWRGQKEGGRDDEGGLHESFSSLDNCLAGCFILWILCQSFISLRLENQGKSENL